MKRLTLTLLLLAAFCAAAGAQTTTAQTQSPQTQSPISEEKRRDIIRLLDMTKAADLSTQIISQFMGELRMSLPMLPEEQREKVVKAFEEEMRKEFTREKVIEYFVPIYDKYLTAEEVKGLISFYETPLGQKLVDALPAIMRDAAEAGSLRGREAGFRAMSRITTEGLLSPPAPKPAPKPKPRRKRA